MLQVISKKEGSSWKVPFLYDEAELRTQWEA